MTALLDTTIYDAPGTVLDRWDPQILAGEIRVYAETGVWVPNNVAKTIIDIESQGQWPAPRSPQGYVGLMQVGPGSMGSYDLGRVERDPGYSIYAGLSDLALRRKDSGMLPWRNVAVGYFSGHYYPTGSKDPFNTDYQYLAQFDDKIADMVPKGDSGTPDPSQLGYDLGGAAGGVVGSAAHWGGRIGIFALGAVAIAGAIAVMART